MRDVAQIHPTFKDRISYARVNGKPAMSLNISKRTNANIIDTVAKVRAVVEAARSHIPSSVHILYTQDQAPFAQEQVTELQGNIITALALVMIVVVASMGLRSGIIVALSVPVSFLFAMTTIYVIGYTYNFMVMFGLLLGLGLVVDGAIVVTEYADRKLVEGFDRHAAYTLAAKRMFWPVVTSTGATLAAFLPLMFWPGISGKFMRYLPVTVFASLAGSLVYALIIAPCLGALFGKAGADDHATSESLRELEEGDPTKLRTLLGLYARTAERAVRWAPLTCLLMVATLIGSFMLYGAYGKGHGVFQRRRNAVRIDRHQVARQPRGRSDESTRQRGRGAHPRRTAASGASTAGPRIGGDTRRGLDRIGQMFVEIVPRKPTQTPQLRDSRRDPHPNGVVGGGNRRSESDGARPARRQTHRTRVPLARTQVARACRCPRARIHGHARSKACATSTTPVRCPGSNGDWKWIAPRRRCSARTCRRSAWPCNSSPTAEGG